MNYEQTGQYEWLRLAFRTARWFRLTLPQIQVFLR
jgi:hypothetical protein